MKKYCGMCGAPIDKSIGFCPRCDPQRKNFTNENTVDGKKAKRLITRLCLWIVICVLLSTVVTVSLVCLDVVDIPVVDDAVRKVELLFHRKHDWIDATCVDPETCEICGETRGEPKGHDWQDATWLEPRYCPDCEETEGKPLGYSEDPAACDLPQPTLKIAVVSSTGKLKLSWGEVEGATEYEVYRSTDGGKTYSLLTTITGTSVTNTSATAGNTYYYMVKALHSKSGATSAFSSAVSGTCDLPQPTLKITVVSSNGKLKLSWNKVEGASKYELYRSTDGGESYSLLTTTTGTSITNTSAAAGNKYYYKVKAIHSNSSANSVFSSVVTGTCDLPRPELKIVVVSSTGKLKLSWNKVEGASKYELYRSTDGGKTYNLLKTTTGTSVTNSSAAAGDKYYYKVKAIHSNSSANSAFSSVVIGTCDLARPNATVKLNSSGKPVVSWEKVSGAAKYTVYIYDADGELVKTVSTTSLNLVHSSALKGKTYSYRVVAVHNNTNANSAKSTAVSIKSK